MCMGRLRGPSIRGGNINLSIQPIESLRLAVQVKDKSLASFLRLLRTASKGDMVAVTRQLQAATKRHRAAIKSIKRRRV